MKFDVITGRHSPDRQPVFVKSSAVSATRTLEGYDFRDSVHTAKNKLVLSDQGNFKKDIDISWLPVAAESYQISADIKDYILVDVPAVTVDIPNRNLQAFPFEEVSYFDPLYGKQIFSTFVGKPSHVDHQNKDPYKAKGVIIDATLQFVPKWGVWKIRVLQGFDRSKDEMLAKQILNGERRGYSMGALVEAFICSVCGRVETNHAPCAHISAGKGSIFNGRLTYQACCGVNYIENSSVPDPADVTAESDNVWA